MENKKISIIIPVFNGEKYIKETLSRILSSIEQNLEVVIVDDGSTDHSPLICSEIAEKDPRVFLYRKINEGIVSARNYGIEKSSGSYICFCDQDDIVFPFTYSEMKKKLASNNADICICSTGRWIDNKIVPYEVLKNEVYTKESIKTNLIYPLLLNGYRLPQHSDTTYIYPHIWKCMIKKEILDTNHLKFKRFINYEDDLIMLFDILCYSKNVVTISEILYCWRLNYSSESYKKSYISNLEKKQEQLLDYFVQKLKKLPTEAVILEFYQKGQICRFYLDRISNELSPYSPNTFIQKVSYLKKSIFTADSKSILKLRHYLKPGQYKAKVGLYLLSRKQLILSYIFLKLYEQIVYWGLKIPLLSRIERKLKHIT